MSEFKQIFNQAQQFLILQAYIDSQLTEEELMNFTLLETIDEIPVVFYPKGVMIIRTAIDLDQFAHEDYSTEEISLQQEKSQLVVQLPDRKLQFQFETVAEMDKFVSDLRYLFSL